MLITYAPACETAAAGAEARGKLKAASGSAAKTQCRRQESLAKCSQGLSLLSRTVWWMVEGYFWRTTSSQAAISSSAMARA